MSGFKEVSFADRQKAAQEAKKNILSRFLGRFLTVCETDFLESTHLMGLVAFVVWCEPHDASSYPLACAMSREN